MAESDTIIAVYGTLRAGQECHHVLADGHSQFMGMDTVSGFDMYADIFPYLTRGTDKAVVEIYRVAPATLASLDELEGHPQLFERTVVKTDGKLTVEAYLVPKEGIPSSAVKIDGDWVTWQKNRSSFGTE